VAQLRRHAPLAGLTIASLLLSFALAPAAAAHSAIEVGKYLVEVGWLTEPTYVGQPNAVQVTIKLHSNESPVNDLGPDDLAVVVSTAGTDSPSLSFDPAFDAIEGIGPLGEYDAAIVPTAPGDYTFHVTGTIHGTAVDIKLASGEETFDPVKGSSDLEFPAKLPNLTEITTRLDRIDGRIVELQAADPGSEALFAAEAAAASADSAAQSADHALLVGLIVGGAGVLLAVVALYVAVRAGRKGTGTA
jgi:hypothetical protein